MKKILVLLIVAGMFVFTACDDKTNISEDNITADGTTSSQYEASESLPEIESSNSVNIESEQNTVSNNKSEVTASTSKSDSTATSQTTTSKKAVTTTDDCESGNCPTYTTKTTTSKPVTTTKVTTAQTTKVTTSSNVSSADFATEVARLVNVERQKAGLGSLTFSTTISKACEIRSNEIMTSFSHTRPNGTSCFTVLKENSISYQASGENIAYGQSTPAAVMTAWMNSEGHKANILSSKFGKIGVAAVKNPTTGQIYWTQLFTD